MIKFKSLGKEFISIDNSPYNAAFNTKETKLGKVQTNPTKTSGHLF